MPAYDLAVAYRVYPKVSPPARTLPFGDDKLALAEACLRSFRDSLGPLRVKLWAVLDTCPPAYTAVFRRYFPASDLEIVPLEKAGNTATFSRQIDILLAQQAAELVYFAEDDYFYLPGQFAEMPEFLQRHSDVDFVSPYDHPDCYRLPLHRGSKLLRAAGARHWRTAASTCLTFLTRRRTLAEYERVFRSYARGNFDCSMWLSLTKHRVRNPLAALRFLAHNDFAWKIFAKAWLFAGPQIAFGRRSSLWVPVPAIATHLDSAGLAPGVNWIAALERSRAELTCAARQSGDD
jgi:hypothetical protein